MKEDKTIEQLFRKEFESFEVQPSKKVWRGVRTNLFIKNFFHFSPWSINVWYIGAAFIIASVLTYTLIKPDNNFTSKINVPVETGIINLIDTLSPGNPARINGQSLKKENRSSKMAKQGRKVGERNWETGVRRQMSESTNLKHETVLQPDSVINPEFRHALDKLTVGDYKNTFSGQPVIAWFECSVPEGCAPLSTTFHNYSHNAVRYSWSFGDGGTSELSDPSYIFDEPGTFFVSLTAYSPNNEISIFTDSIQVNALPEARFSMDIQGLPGEGQSVYFYNYSRGADSYLWYFGDGSNSSLSEPQHYFSKKAQTDIKLLAFSTKGCIDSTILLDAFKKGEPVFIFPTAFSPNTSGPQSGQYLRKNPRNDIFFPFVEEDPEEYQLKIFNRYGILIFESSDFDIGWDGYYRQDLLPQGVYVWKARAKFSDGRSVVKMGDVTLLWGQQ